MVGLVDLAKVSCAGHEDLRFSFMICANLFGDNDGFAALDDTPAPAPAPPICNGICPPGTPVCVCTRRISIFM